MPLLWFFDVGLLIEEGSCEEDKAEDIFAPL